METAFFLLVVCSYVARAGKSIDNIIAAEIDKARFEEKP